MVLFLVNVKGVEILIYFEKVNICLICFNCFYKELGYGKLCYFFVYRLVCILIRFGILELKSKVVIDKLLGVGGYNRDGV